MYIWDTKGDEEAIADDDVHEVLRERERGILILHIYIYI